jgi:hypothetical protein
MEQKDSMGQDMFLLGYGQRFKTYIYMCIVYIDVSD